MGSFGFGGGLLRRGEDGVGWLVVEERGEGTKKKKGVGRLIMVSFLSLYVQRY
jgi:hypothetical protein